MPHSAQRGSTGSLTGFPPVPFGLQQSPDIIECLYLAGWWDGFSFAAGSCGRLVYQVIEGFLCDANLSPHCVPRVAADPLHKSSCVDDSHRIQRSLQYLLSSVLTCAVSPCTLLALAFHTECNECAVRSPSFSHRRLCAFCQVFALSFQAYSQRYRDNCESHLNEHIHFLFSGIR